MCVLIIDTDGLISDAGSGAASFAGTTVAVGRSFIDLVAPEYARRCSDALHDARAGSPQIVHFRTTDSTAWTATLVPLSFDSAATVAAVIRRSPPASLQKDQLLARGVRSVAHDLNNVLTVIVGLNGLMASGDDERRELYTAEIGKAADRATRLAAELLAFGRKPDTEVRVFGVNALLLELQPMLRRMIPPSFNLATDVSDRVDPIRVDRAIVETMIIDLVANIVQTMPSGGQLALRTFSETSAPAIAAAPAREASTYTVWETSATGESAENVGMPAAFQAAAIDCGAFVTQDTRQGVATMRVHFRTAERSGIRLPLP